MDKFITMTLNSYLQASIFNIHIQQWSNGGHFLWSLWEISAYSEQKLRSIDHVCQGHGNWRGLLIHLSYQLFKRQLDYRNKFPIG